jgi:septal ring factor EnvC (AmiA/AmiB activator)
MAGKTNTEAIRDLENTVAMLGERVESLRRDIERVETAHAKTVESLTRLTTQVAVLEARLADLQKKLEESERKRWMIWLAVIGSLLTLAANLVLSFLRK